MKNFRGLWRLTAVVTALGMLGGSGNCVYAQGNTSVQAEDAEVTYTDNLSSNAYGRSRNDYKPDTIKSYLIPNADGTLSRLEYDNGTILLENYDTNLKLIRSSSIPMELDLFGGFFQGEQYNWIVFGGENDAASEDVEVFRIVKYSKNWKRLEDCRLTGQNTIVPFPGGCRMAEYAGNLYVRTCHGMFNGHQANIMFEINEQTMILTDVTDGWVSHSFDQFVDTTDGKLTAVDLGDGYPRAIVWFQYPQGADEEKALQGRVYYSMVLPIAEADNSKDPFAYNATGVSIGGYRVSKDHYMVAYSSVDQSSNANQISYQAPRNIFIASMPRSGQKDVWNTVQITNYTEGQAFTPQFVKVADDKYLLLWEYTADNTNADFFYLSNTRYSVNYCLIDGAGQMLTPVYIWNTADGARISDCVPVIWNDKVVWYTCDKDRGLRVYTIDCNDIEPVARMRTVAEPHHHVYPDEWSYDAQYHWRKCTAPGCDGTVVNKGEHFRGYWVTDRYATTEEPGSKHEECWECGYIIQTLEIPQLTPAPTETSTPAPTATPAPTFSPEITPEPGNTSTSKPGESTQIDMDVDTAKYYNINANGGTWDGTHYYLSSGQMVRNSFFSDGSSTYYLQADGTPMKERLTYHPDGKHVIYFDSDGHEIFSDFANVTMSIAGTAVDDMCFFDTFGYMYVDTLTYDKTGTKLYYVNPYGVLERTGWFQFSGNEFDAGLGFSGKSGGYGYANSDCSLMTNTYTYDWNGNYAYIQGDGHMK